MNKTYNKAVIIMIPVAFIGSNNVVKKFMGKEFKTLADASTTITGALKEDEDQADTQVLAYPIDSFCEACNSQEIDNLNEYFITTVYVGE